MWRIDDRRDIAGPSENPYIRTIHYGNIFVFHPVERALELPDGEKARDINAIEEVPDSTWFRNRIGLYDVAPAEVASAKGHPPHELSFILTAGKKEGTAPGAIAEDQTGRTFLVKFVPPTE